MRFFSVSILCAAAVTIGTSGSMAATYELAVIQNAPLYGGTTSVSDISINNVGTLAMHRILTSGSISTNVGGIEIRPTSGATEFIQTGTGFNALSEGRFPQINDEGDVLAYLSGPLLNGFPTVRYVVFGADGTSRTVAYIAPNSGGSSVGSNPTFKEMSRIAINKNGDVAALVTTLDNKFQIIRFGAGGSPPVVIAEASLDLFSFSGPDINDAGEVVFVATKPTNSDPSFGTTVSVYKSDGTTLEEAIEIPAGPFPSGIPSINNSGDIFVAGAQPGSGAPFTILLEAGSLTPTVTPVGVGSGSGGIQAAFFNDYGQQAYLLDNKLYIDGVLVVGEGTVIPGLGTVTDSPGAFGPVGILPGVSFNNLGQAVAGVFTKVGSEISATNSRILVSPEGATPDHPLMPFFSSPTGQNDIALNIFNGLGVDAPIWVDPIVATGFTYTQGAGGANFASLIIPAALPMGDNSFILEFLYGGGMLFSDILLAGVTFDFTAWLPGGVNSFSIFGIDVGEMVDPTDPFVVGLTFVSGGFQSTLSIDATTSNTDVTPVPLPASGLLLFAAIIGLGVAVKLRSGGHSRRLA